MTLRYNFKRASLWGCVLPDGVKPDMLRTQGAVVLENPVGVPFKVRATGCWRVCSSIPIDV